MQFDEYRELASRTAGTHFYKEYLELLQACSVEEESAKKLANFLSIQKGIFISALGLAGEAGEVADYLKKVYGHNHKLDNTKLKKELGDVLWYVADLCTKFDISFNEVANLNVQKLKERYPEGFSAERSQARKPGDI